MKNISEIMRLFIALMIPVCLSSCSSPGITGDFSAEETALIREASEGMSEASGVPPGTMRVLTIEDSLDLAVLRGISRNLSADALLSDEFAMLSGLMVATVTHPTQDGVGIAAPQVGLNRRVVAVQRFDKEGEPFEVYPNIRIVCLSDSVAYGPEGCLSVPDMRADVLRSQEVVIEYTDIERLKEIASGLSPRKLRRHLEREYGGESVGASVAGEAGSEIGWRAGGKFGGRQGWWHDWRHGRRHDGRHDWRHGAPMPTVRDTISGFTAVIFQHETDHLDGILYIDRL